MINLFFYSLVLAGNYRFKYDGYDSRYPNDYQNLKEDQNMREIYHKKKLLDLINTSNLYDKLIIIKNNNVLNEDKNNIYNGGLLDDWDFKIN